MEYGLQCLINHPQSFHRFLLLLKEKKKKKLGGRVHGGQQSCFWNVHPYSCPLPPDQQPADIMRRECSLLALFFNRFPKVFFFFFFSPENQLCAIFLGMAHACVCVCGRVWGKASSVSAQFTCTKVVCKFTEGCDVSLCGSMWT